MGIAIINVIKIKYKDNIEGRKDYGIK